MSACVPAELIATALGLTARGVRLRAAQETWVSTFEPVQGGAQTLYPIGCLPDDVRTAVMNHLAATAAPPVALAHVHVHVREGGADWQRRREDARRAILLEIDRLADMGGGLERAIRTVIQGAEDGTLASHLLPLVPIANARSGGDATARTLSRRTIYDWRKKAATGQSLASSDGGRPAPIPAWAPWLLKAYRVPSKPALADVLRRLPDTLPEGVGVPSYDQARRFLTTISVVDKNRGRMGPNALRSIRGFKRRDTSKLMPLDIVTSDGHCLKADVAHPATAKKFRPEVVAVLDVATRYCFGWSAGVAESTWCVMDAIANGVSNLGLFGIFYTDNGSGFVNECMTEEVVGFLSRLGATPSNSQPGRPQSRGGVERVQGTLWIKAAKTLPTYQGRDMDNEARRRVVKRIERDLRLVGTSQLLMPWADFLAWAQKSVNEYNARPHRSLPMTPDPITGKRRHMSPAECLEDWRERGWQAATLSPEQAEDLWRPYELRKALRGEVKLPWGRYFSLALEPFHGETVRVGYDIHDGSKVWVRDRDGRLICTAERDGNLVDHHPQSKVQHARETRAAAQIKLREQHIADIQAERKGPTLIEYTPEPTVEDLLQADRQMARLQPDPVPVAVEVSADGRPHFDDDVSWARWVLANPDKAETSDHELLRRRMGSVSFRLLLGLQDDESEAAAG